MILGETSLRQKILAENSLKKKNSFGSILSLNYNQSPSWKVLLSWNGKFIHLYTYLILNFEWTGVILVRLKEYVVITWKRIRMKQSALGSLIAHWKVFMYRLRISKTFKCTLKVFCFITKKHLYLKSNILKNYPSISINKVSKSCLSLQLLILNFFFLRKNLKFLKFSQNIFLWRQK